MPVPSTLISQYTRLKMASAEGEELIEETLEEAFFEAVRKNDFDAASLMAKMPGVDVNKTNCMNKSPLYFALENENIPMVEMLFGNGADVNLPSYNSTYCSFETPITTAVRLQHLNMVDMLLDHKCELEGFGNSCKEGKAALQWAATYGDLTLSKKLVAHGADVNWIGPYFHTALHYATLSDKPDMVQWLLEEGATVSINGDGRTPLHIAAVRGNLPIVKHLMKRRCDVEAKDNFNFTAFSLACLRGHLPIIKYIIDNSPTDVNFNLNDGLHRAAECGHLSVIEYLLSKGADVNSTNTLGESALSIASRGQSRTTNLLLQSGAKINVVDKRGYTPLQHALLREQVDIAVMLMKHGSYLHTYNPATESPLQISVTTSNPVLVKCLLDAGCCLSKEPWFSAEHAEAELQDLDYHRSIRFHHQTSMHKNLWMWIINKVRRPQTLMEANRMAIRNQLLIGSGGRSILQSIQNLPLPQSLKKYVALEDELFNV